MDILEKIRKQKEVEVAERKGLYPVKLLQKSLYYNTTVVSLSEYIRREDKSGVIAEFKKKSPSEGFINQYANVEEISIGYMQSGASALSILTDEHFFGGSSDDLRAARTFNYCPILRKDFIIDEYQVHETKAIGADAILLIAAMLTKSEVSHLTNLSQDLGLEVLYEIHEADELDKFVEGIEVVGVNNRNLKDFTVDISRSEKIFDKLPEGPVKISESGIRNEDDMIRLNIAGYEGFLVGTQFMKTSHPEKSCRLLIESYIEKRSNE